MTWLPVRCQCSPDSPDILEDIWTLPGAESFHYRRIGVLPKRKGMTIYHENMLYREEDDAGGSRPAGTPS